MVIVTSMVPTAAHCPTVGVNVYVIVPTAAVLIVAGVHVPVIPFVEVKGKTGAALFRHSGPIAVKIGVTIALIVISIVVTSAP